MSVRRWGGAGSAVVVRVSVESLVLTPEVPQPPQQKGRSLGNSSEMSVMGQGGTDERVSRFNVDFKWCF